MAALARIRSSARSLSSGAHEAASRSEMKSVSIADRFHDPHISIAMVTRSELGEHDEICSKRSLQGGAGVLDIEVRDIAKGRHNAQGGHAPSQPRDSRDHSTACGSRSPNSP